MKILLVNDYSEQIGGTEVYIQTISEELTKLGHQVGTYYGSNNYKTSVREQKKLSSYINRIFSIKHYFRFKKLVNTFQPDAIHLHNIFNEVSPSILLATKNIPVVMTIHDYQIVQAVFDTEERIGKKCAKEVCDGCLNCVGLKGLVFEKIKRAIHKPLLDRVKTFIAPSQYMQRIVTKHSPYMPILVYNGFYFKKPFKFHGNNVALYSGRLSKDKGVEYFIESIPQIIKTLPDFMATIAGDGILKKDLMKKASDLRINRHVRFLGHLNTKEVLEQYEKCSIVVIPSIWPENLPTVCIEALSLGRPVIASNVGGIPEIVSAENAILVPPKRVNGLTDAITTLLKDKKKLYSYSLATTKNLEKFSMNTHIRRLLEIYLK